MIEDLYCKVYIATKLSKDELLKRLAKILNGQVTRRTVMSEIMEADLIKSKDYHSRKMKEEYGFVYYPFYLEIEPIQGTNFSCQRYISDLSNLIRSFLNESEDAVAACSFEEKLPSRRQ